MITPTTQGPEMRRLTSNAVASRGPLRKEIFPKPQIPQCRKVLYNDALTNARLLYNCQVWNALTEGDRANVEVEYVKATGWQQDTRQGITQISTYRTFRSWPSPTDHQQTSALELHD